ncbi:MAG: hypothetical protein JWO03_3063 [Bacteroidetes bacterium]|nr:hypothetical protein [Bacteroidota bacterium]
MIMKKVIEFDTDTEKGAKLIKYIEQLDASHNDIHILNEPSLTDEEVAMPPTRKVSQATLDAYLEPKDDEQGFTAKESLAYIRKLRNEERKKK